MRPADNKMSSESFMCPAEYERKLNELVLCKLSLYTFENKKNVIN